ncbi:hypothetical protein [Microbacterium natoriense]|uniref:hypothetical protein n=1 Tax=Microbacterium natoriense TaxID=284570 RepID=UPI0031D025A0
MHRRRRNGGWMLTGAAVAAVLATALTGCAPQPGPSDWTLAPIPFGAERADIAYGMSHLTPDGDGGFWAVSSGSWLHVDAEEETVARFNAPLDSPLSRVTAMATLSPTELVVVRDEGAPVLAVLDTSTMSMRDLPGEAPSGSGGPTDFGDFEFGDVAVQSGAAIVIRYRVGDDGALGYEVLRVSLDDGARTLLHSEPLDWSDAPGSSPDLPPVDVDVDATGAVHIATRTARVVLEPDGAERSRAAQNAERPHVAVAADGTALWWGGGARDSAEQGVVVGGSSEARASIEARSGCADALLLTDAGGDEHPLPFLCGANAAARVGDSWVVAIGGEGDGVLVRLVPPSRS